MFKGPFILRAHFKFMKNIGEELSDGYFCFVATLRHGIYGYPMKENCAEFYHAHFGESHRKKCNMSSLGSTIILSTLNNIYDVHIFSFCCNLANICPNEKIFFKTMRSYLSLMFICAHCTKLQTLIIWIYNSRLVHKWNRGLGWIKTIHRHWKQYNSSCALDSSSSALTFCLVETVNYYVIFYCINAKFGLAFDCMPRINSRYGTGATWKRS